VSAVTGASLDLHVRLRLGFRLVRTGLKTTGHHRTAQEIPQDTRNHLIMH